MSIDTQQGHRRQQRGSGDTGSPEVQVALLTARIEQPTGHFKTHKGSPQPSRSAADGQPPPQPARLPEEEGRRALQGPDREAAACVAKQRIPPRRSDAPRFDLWHRNTFFTDCGTTRSSVGGKGRPPVHSRTASSRNTHVAKITKTFQYGKHTVTLETGEIARQAGGAVIVKFDDTVLLVSAVAAKSAREGQDFFPLTCRLPGEVLRRWPHPGWLLQARRPPDREGNADLASDRSPDRLTVPGRLQRRSPDHRR